MPTSDVRLQRCPRRSSPAIVVVPSARDIKAGASACPGRPRHRSSGRRGHVARRGRRGLQDRQLDPPVRGAAARAAPPQDLRPRQHRRERPVVADADHGLSAVRQRRARGARPGRDQGEGRGRARRGVPRQEGDNRLPEDNDEPRDDRDAAQAQGDPPAVVASFRQPLGTAWYATYTVPSGLRSTQCSAAAAEGRGPADPLRVPRDRGQRAGRRRHRPANFKADEFGTVCTAVGPAKKKKSKKGPPKVPKVPNAPKDPTPKTPSAPSAPANPHRPQIPTVR
jgi:hypothetical protein